jgi:3-dehydro-L-gulonate 2-dehydrogenase
MLRVPFADLFAVLERAMLRLGFPVETARLSARLFAETTRDGVYSHGLNRFPRVEAMVANGSIDVHARPRPAAAFGSIERWDGKRGIGNVNAYLAMQRTIELARKHGMGMVALANTNHWMRGGAFGWQAAEEGMFAMCWSNTLANMPPWGSTEPALGNNPLVIAVPRADGRHVVLDMAMSQYSYGALASYARRGEPLPLPGGFDAQGRTTQDAAAIEASQRPFPIGYWKGSGLSLVLDMMAAMLSGGLATHQLPLEPTLEAGQSQIFLAIDPSNIAPAAELNHIADDILEHLHQARPEDPARPIRYPGEQMLQLREENTRLGVPVDPELWQRLSSQ